MCPDYVLQDIYTLKIKLIHYQYLHRAVYAYIAHSFFADVSVIYLIVYMVYVKSGEKNLCCKSKFFRRQTRLLLKNTTFGFEWH